MEVTNYEGAEDQALRPQSESAAIDMIRTETVLSRLPVHNLAKKGRVDIRILKTTPTGEVELQWEVSYNERYGQARQLAYKLDTIVINQRVEEAGRPLPRMLRIGSLGEIGTELGIAQQGGKSKNELKRAFLQNASAFIAAKYTYKANDRSEREVKAAVTRYGVIFTGEKLPDGRKADAVYVIFNDPFWEVLNTAPVRPLDRAYMKELPPAAQRFYEIVSRKIFAALKNDYPRAKISYSEYCIFSAQIRHYERQRVQDQMAKVLRHHKESGYITAVKYESTIDAENKPDWIMYLTPGPKAHAEFAVAHGRRVPRKIAAAIEAGDEAKRRRFAPRESAQHSGPPSGQTFDLNLVAEFTRRGITEIKTRHLLANLKPGQDVLAQLELIDQMVQKSRIPIENPPGFYIRLIESNTFVPENFETSAKRKAREEMEQKERERRAAEDARQLLEWDYEDYCVKETERYIQENPAALEAIQQTKWNENHELHPSFSAEMITSIAANEAKRAIRKQLPLPSFDEFVLAKQQGTDFSLKPVALPPAAEPASEAQPLEQAAVAEEATVAESDKSPSMSEDHVAPVNETEAVIEPALEPANIPAAEEAAIPEVPIELVAEFPPENIAGTAIEAESA